MENINSQIERDYKFKVAIIDDDQSALELLEYNFLKAGFNTLCFTNSLNARHFLIDNKVDFIITDWMMPEIDGYDLVMSLRQGQNKDTAKFMVSCKSEESQVVQAFSSGIDGFMSKPLRVKELIARVEYLLKKQEVDKKEKLGYQGLYLDKSCYETTLDGKKINLSKSEFFLVELLIRNKGTVFSRQEILYHLNNGEYYPTDRSVDVMISGIRKKLGTTYASKIQSVYGLGYKII